MAEPGRKLTGKKSKGRRAGLNTKGRKKDAPKNVAPHKAKSRKGAFKQKSPIFW